MTILIVDDDPLCVNGIANSLPFDMMGIHNVHKAYSMSQAQEIFANNPIDILLCDIEMPRGNGIDLVTWVRQGNYETICIFLTSFSLFEYASSAIKLQIFDYVLKPCEYTKLRDVLIAACDKVRSNRVKKQMELSGEYWNDTYKERLNQFWAALLLNRISSEPEQLKRELQLHHLDAALASQRYYLFVFVLIPHAEMTTWTDESSWKYAISNITNELLFATPAITYEHVFSVITPENAFNNEELYYNTCRQLVDTLSSVCPAEWVGYCSPPCAIEELNAVGQQLRRQYSERFSYRSTVFRPDILYTPIPAPTFSDEIWQNYILSNRPDAILGDLEEYFRRPCHNAYYDRQTIQMLYHQVVRCSYSALKSCFLAIPQDLMDEGQNRTVVYGSIHAFLQWVSHTVTEVTTCISQNDASASVIGKISTYIHENISSDLNRDELANVVHLHPNYLSALFHQQTGMSLSEFITAERLKEARRLLLSTDLPVNEIAIRTGFSNISYFSKIFKEDTGTTPLKYRKGKASL